MNETAKFLIEAFYALDSKSKDYARNAISIPDAISQEDKLSDAWERELVRISEAVQDGSMPTSSSKGVLAEIRLMTV